MRVRKKAMAAAGVLAGALTIAGCGGSSIEGEYQGTMEHPDGGDRTISLEVEERNDGSLRALMEMDGDDRELRLAGDEPVGGQFSVIAEPGDIGYETVIDGEVSGSTLEADFFTDTTRSPIVAERQ